MHYNSRSKTYKTFKFTSISILLCLFCCSVSAKNSSALILDRHKKFLLNTIDVSKAGTYSTNLNKENRWDDITYVNIGFGVLGAREHLLRVRVLAAAWANSKSKYFHQKNVWDAFNAGLNDWLQHKYHSSNWWHNEIGTPQVMRDIVVLIRENLTKEEYQEAINVISQYRVNGTGANLIWSADIALSYAALHNNTAKVNEYAKLIVSEVKVTTDDGIQPDFSYHQHGNRLQIYHYGGDFLKDNIRIAWELSGTEWAYPEEKIKILTDFVLNGWQWMARGVYTIPATIDRAASRENALKLADLRKELPYLIELNRTKKVALKKLLKGQNNGGYQLEGFRYYPTSDFAVFHRKEFSFFLKTISNKTLPTESINDENLKGELLNNGNTYFVQNGNEYFNLMALWNWKLIPGSTSFSGATKIEKDTYSKAICSEKSGFVIMDYKVSDDFTGYLTARKMWACHKNTVVCLLANVQTHNITDSVFTVMDQSRLSGDVIVNGKLVGNPHNTTSKVDYIYHNKLIYKPIVSSQIKLLVDERHGNWSTINILGNQNVIKETVFMPLLLNSTQNKNTGYSVTFCAKPILIDKTIRSESFQIVANDSACQAVQFKDGTLMLAFTQKGNLTLKNGDIISVNTRCLILSEAGKYYVSGMRSVSERPVVTLNNKEIQYIQQ